MRVIFVLLLCTFFFSAFSQGKSGPLGFIENKGQIVDQHGRPNPGVKYLLNTNGLNVQLRSNGFSYDVYEAKEHPSEEESIRDFLSDENKKNSSTPLDNKVEYRYHRIDIDFLGSNQTVRLIAEHKSADFDNYYNVAHAANGILNVHSYHKVTYKDLYENIDVVFFIPEDSSKPVEYNFIIHPGGNTDAIKLRFNGAKTELAENRIRMKLRFGQMEETIPLSWIENGISKEEIGIAYKQIKKNVFGFTSPERKPNETIVIDPVPVRLWGTYYGKGTNFELSGLETDSAHNLYYSGSTIDPANIATAGSHDAIFSGFSDGFLVKFNPDGTRIWGTYYGGSHSDSFTALKEHNGELILTGSTRSTDNIATPGAFKENLTPGGFSVSDVFIVKFDLDGQRIWGTYFGGEHDDASMNLAINQDGTFIIVGDTYSVNGIATPGTFKDFRTVPVDPHTIAEGFIAKFSNSGHQIWGSYYYLCQIRGLDIDSSSNIYFSGDVYSASNVENFTSPGTHQPTFMYNTGSGVAFTTSFIVKFSQAGQRIWGTYYGRAWEKNHCLKVDHDDNIYISGYTHSELLIATPNAFQTTLNTNVQTPSDAYLAKFDPSGNIIWATYYGGDEHEGSSSYTIDVDENNNVFLSGSTSSTNNISTPDAASVVSNGGHDIFIAKFAPTGSRIWGSYFGGNSTDYCTIIKYDSNGIFYIAGSTFSTTNIATPGSHQTFLSDQRCYFVEKFEDCQSALVTASNSPVCIGQDLELFALGGSSYSWTGPNGFTSNQQNPIIPNATPANSGDYYCTITSGGGCNGNQAVSVVVGDPVKPIPDIIPLPDVTSDCNTTVSIPTATDNCTGPIVATTNHALNFSLPGTYIINWTYNDGNGNIETQLQSVIINAVALPDITTPQTFCSQQNATIASLSISGQNIKWYDTQSGGTLLAETTPLQNGTNYYASQTINGCESLSVAVFVNIQTTPPPTGIASQSFCTTQNPELSDIVLNETDIVWYSSPTGGSPLPATTALITGTYYASQIILGCESIDRIAIAVDIINTVNASDFSIVICDSAYDGTETITLADYNSELISSPGSFTFQYYNTLEGAENQAGYDLIAAIGYDLHIGTDVIYVRITSAAGCFQIVRLNLTLVANPVITIPDTIRFCENTFTTVNAGAGFSSYLWSTGAVTPSIHISEGGNYSVTVTRNHGNTVCSSTHNFTAAMSNAATITSIDTKDWTYNTNTIIVNVTGWGTYEYSIDGTQFQSSNIFENLQSGTYTVYVRDINECGVMHGTAYLLMYPPFFTPNGDGFNDSWKINFSELERNLRVEIFDRYGKLLKSLNNFEAWDGRYNSVDLPSSDYWFVVLRANGVQHRGHFALKR